MSPRASTNAVAAAAVLLCAGWFVVYAVTGHLSDDGLHAYAAREILHGRRLYADFQYHQAPLFPMMLSRWFALTGVAMTAAKTFAAGIGAMTLLAAAALARRCGAGPTGLAAMLLACGLCPSLMLHLGYAQSQATATLLALGAALLDRVGPAAPSDARATDGAASRALSGFLLGLACGARISFGALLLPFAWRRDRRTVVLLLAGFAVGAGLVYGPYLAAGGLADALYLPLGTSGGGVTRHFAALYLAGDGPLSWLTMRLGSLPNQLIYYAPLWLWLAAAAHGRDRRHDRLLAVAFTLTIVHGLLPRRINHSYLVVAMPFWAAWLACQPLPIPTTRRGRVVAGALLVAAAAIAGSRGVGRIDRSGGRSVRAELKQIGGVLARLVEPDEPVFTFAVEFAVAADRAVVPGLAPGYFSFYPNMSDADARACHVLNEHLALQQLESARAPVLLLHTGAFEPLAATEYDWPGLDRIERALERGYVPVQRWEGVGEHGTELTLWVRRRAGAGPESEKASDR